MAILLAMLVLDRAYHLVLPDGLTWSRTDVGHLLIDSVCACLFVAVALRANRMYPLCLAGLQLVALISHLEHLLSPAVSRAAYHSLMVLPSYLQMLALGLGILNHLGRIRKFGPYPDWRNTSSLSRRTAPMTSRR